MSLVVVDDHRVFTELFSETLQSAGYRVLATSVTLVEGIATIEQLHPDVVVLDRNLPDGDGLAALETDPSLSARYPSLDAHFVQ